MTDSERLDEESVVRFAVHGAVDDACRDIERRFLEGEPAIVEGVQFARRTRALLEFVDDAAPPPELVDRTWSAMKAAIGATDRVSEIDVPVFRAVRFEQHLGLRALTGADINLVCAFGAYRLSAVMHSSERPDRFGLSGQIVQDGARPAVGVSVALLVDRVVVARTHTDEFGEFEFFEHDGDRFGVRVGDGPSAASIELKDDSGW